MRCSLVSLSPSFLLFWCAAYTCLDMKLSPRWKRLSYDFSLSFLTQRELWNSPTRERADADACASQLDRTTPFHSFVIVENSPIGQTSSSTYAAATTWANMSWIVWHHRSIYDQYEWKSSKQLEWISYPKESDTENPIYPLGSQCCCHVRAQQKCLPSFFRMKMNGR